MGQFILGVLIALFVGAKLGRLLDSAQSSRGDYRKARGGLPGARKKATSALFGFVRMIALVVVVLAALVYGWIHTAAK
jgi:hypothetical protein